MESRLGEAEGVATVVLQRQPGSPELGTDVSVLVFTSLSGTASG